MKKYIVLAIASLIFVGCAGFKTTYQRSLISATTFAYLGMTTWGQYYDMQMTDPKVPDEKKKELQQVRLAVDDASRKFAATVSMADGLLAAYETNSAVKPQLNSILLTINSQSSNLVWTINYLKH